MQAKYRVAIPLAMQAGDVPGLAMVVLEKGKTAKIAGFGVRCYGKPEPVTADTFFPAASLTKPVFAYAVHKLVENGILDLDVPLDSYLPQPYLPTDTQAAATTARHVLSHQSGFPNWREKNKLLRTKWPPGIRFSYSGEGFIYLQRVVEHVTGQRLDAHLQEHVFDPLNMHNSTLVWQSFIEERAAWGYGNNRNWPCIKTMYR